jgi:hypothetical protein
VLNTEDLFIPRIQEIRRLLIYFYLSYILKIRETLLTNQHLFQFLCFLKSQRTTYRWHRSTIKTFSRHVPVTVFINSYMTE